MVDRAAMSPDMSLLDDQHALGFHVLGDRPVAERAPVPSTGAVALGLGSNGTATCIVQTAQRGQLAGSLIGLER